MNKQERGNEQRERERENSVQQGSVLLKSEKERVVGEQAGSKEGFGIRGQHSQHWRLRDLSVHQVRTTEASWINPKS